MDKLRLPFLASCAALALLAFGPAQAADEIVLGATVPITGPLAGSGVQYYNALRLAQDDINAAGGINGAKLRIVFEDTQASNSVAVNAFLKLVKQENPPFIFLSSYTIQNLAVEPEVAKAKVPTMYAGGAIAVHERNNPYMFRIRPIDSLQATAMADAVANRLKVKKAGILYVQDDFGLGAANITEATLTKSGVEVVGKEAFGGRDNDFSAQLLSLKNKGAEALVSFAYNRDGALILKQRKSLGINLPYVGAQATPVPATLDLLDPSEVEGIMSTTDAVLGEAYSPESAAFAKRYAEKFNLRADPFGSCYYDGAMIVADAIRKVGTDKEKIRDYLTKVKDYKGVTRNFTTDDKLNMAHDVALISFVPGTKDFKLEGYFPPKTR